MIITWRSPGRAARASTPAVNVARFGATYAAGSGGGGGGGSTGPGIWLASVRTDAVYPVAVWPEAVRARVR